MIHLHPSTNVLSEPPSCPPDFSGTANFQRQNQLQYQPTHRAVSIISPSNAAGAAGYTIISPRYSSVIMVPETARQRRATATDLSNSTKSFVVIVLGYQAGDF